MSRSKQTSQRIGYALGTIIIAFGASMLAFDFFPTLRAPGPFNIGHEKLACAECHRAAPGNFRQQARAALLSFLEVRTAAAEVGALPVGNAVCNECHARAEDDHPAYRFSEPRFRETRRLLAADRCATCHQEHGGVRVTVATDFCRHCHGELIVTPEVLEVPHEILARLEAWDRCLGCHDFHGGRVARSPAKERDAVPIERVRRYFAGAASPYGGLR